MLAKYKRSHQSYRKVAFRHSLTLTNTSATYNLPHHKSSSLGEGCEILLLAQSLLDPLPLVRWYVMNRDAQFPYHPHLWLTASGTIPT
ncbi:hypothetical protein BDR04DRAFT_1191420 [Suillus decipiens]|nr:hypothetical protein BDR04DRAFT_1191420 [Suillus decipiens]